MSRSEAEKDLKYLPITVTGIRSGEIIAGNRTQSEGTVLQFLNATYPASKQSLDNIKSFPTLWTELLNKIGSFDFFMPLSLAQREEWLWSNSTTAVKLYLSDLEGAELKLLKIGSEMQSKIPTNLQNELLAGKTIKFIDLEKQYPRKPGSRAKHPTLVFRPSLWNLTSSHQQVPQFDGITIDLLSGTINSRSSATGSVLVFDFPTSFESIGSASVQTSINEDEDVTQRWSRVGSQKVGFQLPADPPIELNWDTMPQTTNRDKIIKALNYFMDNSPSILKSLIQKIIRFRAKKIELSPELIVDSREVLVVASMALMSLKGSFVPDIKRFVSGLESFCKRTVVSCCEDSYLADSRLLTSLMAGAYLAQRAKGWKPSASLVKQ